MMRYSKREYQKIKWNERILKVIFLYEESVTV